MNMDTAKNQIESFESAVTSGDSFVTASEGLIATEEKDNVEDYPLLECTAPLQGQALLVVNAGQSTVLHFGHEEEGIGKSWNAMEDDYSLLDYTAPLTRAGSPCSECWTSKCLANWTFKKGD